MILTLLIKFTFTGIIEIFRQSIINKKNLFKQIGSIENKMQIFRQSIVGKILLYGTKDKVNCQDKN